MISPQQIRMARAGLRWTIESLSRESGVGSRTIKRIEATNHLGSVNLSTLEKLVAALESAGIEFIEAEDGAPGIIIRTAQTD